MNAVDGVRVLDEELIRRLVEAPEALDAVRRGLIALHRGAVQMPPATAFSFGAGSDEAHVKGAYVDGQRLWTVKVSTGFYGNARHGLPVSDGVSLVFSAETGRLDSVLLDHGYLTDLRTGAAGALAADLLARPQLRHALVVGAGRQARFQLVALLAVRRPERITVFARREAQAAELQSELLRDHGVEVSIASDLAQAASSADLIVTTTPALTPLLRREWIAPGTHITAVGADAPGKQELERDVVACADVVASDLPAAALRAGELAGAIADGLIEPGAIASLGAIAAGDAPGRRDGEQVTLVDLVGTGVADAAIASALLELLCDAQALESSATTTKET